MSAFRSIFVAFGILIGYSVDAQLGRDTIQIGEVNIMAKRKIEEAGLRITRPDSLQRISVLTADLSELIASYSPVFIKSYGRGSTATASFRGSAASHTKVFWNGINLNSPMRGLADLSLVPLYFTDGVFLLHGGSSMTRGSGALGGSIHLENMPDWKTRFGMELMAESGSFHSYKTFMKLLLGGNNIHSSTRIFYESSENDFPFYNTAIIPRQNDTLENADYYKAGFLQEFYLRHFNDNVSTLRLWGQTNDRNLPQLMSYQGSERVEYQKDKMFRGQYDWKKYTAGTNYQFFSGLNITRQNYYRATPVFDFVNQNANSRELSFVNHFRIFRNFDEQTYATVTFDASYFEVEASDLKTGTGYEKERWETSLMVNLHMKPSDRFALFILLRSETYDEQIVPFIPSAGMEWQVVNRLPLVVRMNVARNYNKPSLNDLFWIPGGNSELLPEDGYTGDLSLSAIVEGEIFRFSNELTGFISGIKNWIAWQPSAGGAYYWEAGNIRDVLSRGAEYQFSAEYKNGGSKYSAGGNYAFTSTSNLNAVSSADQSRGKQLIYIPKHKGGAYISAARNNFMLKFDLSAVGKRYTHSNNYETDFEQVLNPYLVGKLMAGKQFIHNDLILGLRVTADNLFDGNYQSILWRPMPGRFYSFTLSLKFNKQK